MHRANLRKARSLEAIANAPSLFVDLTDQAIFDLYTREWVKVRLPEKWKANERKEARNEVLCELEVRFEQYRLAYSHEDDSRIEAQRLAEKDRPFAAEKLEAACDDESRHEAQRLAVEERARMKYRAAGDCNWFSLRRRLRQRSCTQTRTNTTPYGTEASAAEWWERVRCACGQCRERRHGRARVRKAPWLVGVGVKPIRACCGIRGFLCCGAPRRGCARHRMTPVSGICWKQFMMRLEDTWFVPSGLSYYPITITH